MLTFPSAPHHVRHPVANYWSGLDEPRKSTFFFQGRDSTHCFFSYLQIRCVSLLTSPGSIPIWDFFFDISGWHILSARAWTPALMLHLTNPCTKRKVLILTKPKGKIWKTKPLRHYVTWRCSTKTRNNCSRYHARNSWFLWHCC